MKRIAYRAGYKYQLAESYEDLITIHPEREAVTEWIRLLPSGHLVIVAGYAWDGPSGPVLDTTNTIRGSLVHDALYQLIRLGKLMPLTRYAVDETYERMCQEDAAGAWWGWRHILQARAKVHFAALRLFGGGAIEPGAEHPVLRAP